MAIEKEKVKWIQFHKAKGQHGFQRRLDIRLVVILNMLLGNLKGNDHQTPGNKPLWKFVGV